jgi:hypothetical protein
MCQDYCLHSLQRFLKRIRREKKLWVRKWLGRSTHGCSALLLSELRAEEPAEYRAAYKANVKLYIQNHTLCVNTRALNVFEHVVATDRYWCKQASRGSHETSDGQVTCRWWWGMASCLRNRTSFIHLPCLITCQFTCLLLASPQNLGKLMSTRSK